MFSKIKRKVYRRLLNPTLRKKIWANKFCDLFPNTPSPHLDPIQSQAYRGPWSGRLRLQWGRPTSHTLPHTGTHRGAHAAADTHSARGMLSEAPCPLSPHSRLARRAPRLTCLEDHLVIVLGPEGLQHGHEEHPAGVLDAEHRPIAPHGGKHHQPAPAALGRLRGLSARRPRQLYLHLLDGRLGAVRGSRSGPHRRRGARWLRLARPPRGGGLLGEGHHGPRRPPRAPGEREGCESPASSRRSCRAPSPRAGEAEARAAEPRVGRQRRARRLPRGGRRRRASTSQPRDSGLQCTAPHPPLRRGPASRLLKTPPTPLAGGVAGAGRAPDSRDDWASGEWRRGPPAWRSQDPGARGWPSLRARLRQGLLLPSRGS